MSFKLEVNSSWPLNFATDVYPYSGDVTNFNGTYEGVPGKGVGAYYATYAPANYYCSLDSEKETFSYTVQVGARPQGGWDG